MQFLHVLYMFDTGVYRYMYVPSMFALMFCSVHSEEGQGESGEEGGTVGDLHGPADQQTEGQETQCARLLR